MKRLALDFGNSFRKLALLENGEIIAIDSYPTAEDSCLLQRLKEFQYRFRPVSAILSSVNDYPPEVNEFLYQYDFYINLTHNTPLPVHSAYESPETLGKDRLAAAVAGHFLFPSRNVMVIMAGTAITYNIVNQAGIYLGGAISPGLNLRFRALNQFTGRLPLVEKMHPEQITGTNTLASILSGVVNGARLEMDGFIQAFNLVYENLTVILSGGDLKYFDKYLKNDIFATPNLVIKGLDIILDFNEKRKSA